MNENISQSVRLIAIEDIEIVNPRDRNKKSFQDLVKSIERVGLKRPVTLASQRGKHHKKYALVCGQGRMEALALLGETHVPAFVTKASGEDLMLKSLVENCARRQHTAIDLLHDITGMKDRGYSDAQVARKTGLSAEYVRGVSNLMKQGEQRLLRAVESGQMPLYLAVTIASAADEGVQNALQEAYENNDLRGRKLILARKLVENRRRRGKGLGVSLPPKNRSLSPSALMRAYQEDTERKQLLVKKANASKRRLLFITHAMRELLGSAEFYDILTEEKLDTIPRHLSARIERSEVA